MIIHFDSFSVRIQKPELFLECYCVAGKKPIRCKMKKPQAVTVIIFVACGFVFLSPSIKMSKSNQSVHGF